MICVHGRHVYFTVQTVTFQKSRANPSLGRKDVVPWTSLPCGLEGRKTRRGEVAGGAQATQTVAIACESRYWKLHKPDLGSFTRLLWLSCLNYGVWLVWEKGTEREGRVISCSRRGKGLGFGQRRKVSSLSLETELGLDYEVPWKGPCPGDTYGT